MRASTIPRLVAASMLVVVLTACKPARPTFVDEERRYNQGTALLLIGKVGDSGLAAVPVDEASKRRHDALAALRSRGKNAADAAKLITEVFPADTAAVPYYVEIASYEGTSAVVVLEAVGPKGGTLSDSRAWVVSRSGDVLITGTR
jgi:hypothetical protein